MRFAGDVGKVEGGPEVSPGSLPDAPHRRHARATAAGDGLGRLHGDNLERQQMLTTGNHTAAGLPRAGETRPPINSGTHTYTAVHHTVTGSASAEYTAAPTGATVNHWQYHRQLSTGHVGTARHDGLPRRVQFTHTVSFEDGVDAGRLLSVVASGSAQLHGPFDEQQLRARGERMRSTGNPHQRFLGGTSESGVARGLLPRTHCHWRQANGEGMHLGKWLWCRH